MTEIDPAAEALLFGLLESPLAALGEIALVHLRESEDARDARPGTLRDDPERGFRQLYLVRDLIRDLIEREIEMTRDIRSSAGELGIGSVEMLLPPTDGEETRRDKVDENRLTALKTFLQTWESAAIEIEVQLRRPDGL